MAVYKVPQDVEADDKLIGPFSFRQFVYLIIVAIAIGLGWGLSQLFLPLAVLPLPIVLFFGAMALPLRKDQPMEIYMAAVVSFFLKPRKRLWQPDGIHSLVEITASKTVEVQRTKDLSRAEAEQRLSYLADIVDTGGWAVRGVVQPETDSAMQSDVYYEAQQTEDVLDESGGVARSFDNMISQSDAKRHQEILMRMQQLPSNVEVTPPPITDPYASLSPVTDNHGPEPEVTYNPYPTSIRQSIIAPLSEQPPAPQPVAPPIQPTPQPAPVATPTPTPAPPVAAPLPPAAQTPPPSTSEKPVSPDIINLANNHDLSIETISREAKRIKENEEKAGDDQEVVISLR